MRTFNQRSVTNNRTNTIDLIALNKVIEDFAGYQEFESQLPDEDATQVLEIAKGRNLDRELIHELFIKINEREDLIAELGIALHDVLDAHKVDPSRFETIATSLFSAKSDPVVVVNIGTTEMTQLGLVDGQQGALGEHLQYLRGKEVMIIQRVKDKLQIEIISVADDGQATTIITNKVDGNTLFKDNRIAMAEVFSYQQTTNLGSDVPFPVTWHDLVVEAPTPYYLLAKLTLTMGWGEAEIDPLPVNDDKEILKLLKKERGYHLDDPAKLAAIEAFIDNYPKAVNRFLTISSIYQVMKEHQWTISEQQSPYLDDYSPSQILTLAKERMSYYEHLHVAELSVDFISDIDWYQQHNINRLIELLQQHQLVELLTTMPSYQKIFSKQDFGYRDYLQLRVELEDLIHKLPRSHDLYATVAMLPRILKIEQLAKNLAETDDLVASLAELSLPQMTIDELPLKQIHTNLQKIIDQERQPLPPAPVNDQPATTISYVKPHWLPNRVSRQPPSVDKADKSSSKEPGLVNLQNLADNLAPYARIEAINKVLSIDVDKLITKMNKLGKRTERHSPAFDRLIFNDLFNNQSLTRKDLQTANRYLQAIGEVYRRQIPSINFDSTIDRRKGRAQYEQAIGEQLRLVRKELRRRGNGG